MPRNTQTHRETLAALRLRAEALINELKSLHRDAHDLEAASAMQPDTSDHEAHLIATEANLLHHAVTGALRRLGAWNKP